MMLISSYMLITEEDGESISFFDNVEDALTVLELVTDG